MLTELPEKPTKAYSIANIAGLKLVETYARQKMAAASSR